MWHGRTGLSPSPSLKPLNGQEKSCKCEIRGITACCIEEERVQRERCHRRWQYGHRHWPKQKVSHVINMSDKRAGKALSHDLASRNKAPALLL